MFIIDVDLTEGVWKEYEDGVKIKIRPWTPAKYNELRKKHTKYQRIMGQRVEEVDEEALNNDMIDYIIEDWEGIGLANGEPAPCTREMKLKLVNNFVDIGVFIVRTAGELGEELAKKKEEERKNS